MPHFDIVRSSTPKKSFRVASIMGSYDLQDNQIQEHFIGDIDLPLKWQIGLIVGNSGTGKTTIAKELFPDAYFDKFDYTHNNAARVFIATLNGNLCAFTSMLPFPHPKLKNYWKGHRTVVLPDFQGFGIGLTIRNFAAELMKSEGKEIVMTTSNPAMIASLKKSPLWITTRIGRTSRGGATGKIQNRCNVKSTSCERITVSFKYIG